MNLLFIPLTIGLPAIDESLEKLLTAIPLSRSDCILLI